MKKTLLALFFAGFALPSAFAQNTAQLTITGEITNKTCQFNAPADNTLDMEKKEASEFTNNQDVDGVTSKDLDFTCAPDLPIKVTVTDRVQAATNRAYLVNKTGTCNSKTCATGVGVKVRFFSEAGARLGGNTDQNLGTAITLRAAPSNPNYAQNATAAKFKVRGFYHRIGTSNPTPGGVESEALFTFTYQ